MLNEKRIKSAVFIEWEVLSLTFIRSLYFNLLVFLFKNDDNLFILFFSDANIPNASPREAFSPNEYRSRVSNTESLIQKLKSYYEVS